MLLRANIAEASTLRAVSLRYFVIILKRSRWAWAHSPITVRARSTVGSPSTNGLGPRGALRRAVELGRRLVEAGVVGDQHVDVLLGGELAHALGRGDVGIEPRRGRRRS